MGIEIGRLHVRRSGLIESTPERIRLDDFDEDRDWGDHGSLRRDDAEDGKTRRERRRERKQREAADWPENHNRGNTPARIVREINGGGPTLEVRTANGSIRIRD